MADVKQMYECQLCGYQSETRRGVGVHIGNTQDEKHKDKDSKTPGTIQVVEEASEEFLENNDRSGHSGTERTEISRGNATFKGPAEGMDATMSHISNRKVKNLEVTERIALLLEPEEIGEVLSGELSNETRVKIVNQLIALSVDE